MSVFLNIMIVYYLGCAFPLGMEDGRIKDSEITTSSVLKGRTPYGWQARLNQNIPTWGAWCPDVSGGKINERNYDQYIQIDLLHLIKITGIATQGREHLGGREYVKDYKIWYRRDGGMWYSAVKDQTVKVNLIDILHLQFKHFFETLLFSPLNLEIQVPRDKIFCARTHISLCACGIIFIRKQLKAFLAIKNILIIMLLFKFVNR